VFRLCHIKIAMVSGVDATVILPANSKGHLFRMEESIAWKMGTSEADAATGFPIASGEGLSMDGPCEKQAVHFVQSSGSPSTLHWVYQTPLVR
jgi:hypothetical protein